MVAAFCLKLGVVLDCALGDLKQSEQALCAQLLAAGSWFKWIFVGDRNFGVYSVVRSATAASAHVLLRLTEARARKLARQAGHKLRPGLDTPILWTPSSHDQCPQGLEAQPVAGRLVVVRVQIPGFRAQELYLFTTLTDPSLYSAAQLAQLYGQRWQIELFLRYVKTQMDLEFLDANPPTWLVKNGSPAWSPTIFIRSIMVAAAARVISRSNFSLSVAPPTSSWIGSLAG